MYGIQDKINQILRGAETIRKNQSMLTAQSDSIELYHALCDMTKDLTRKTNKVERLLEERDELEAEVGRLQSQFKRAIEIAEEFWNNQKQAVLIYHQELADELAKLREQS